MATPTEDLEDLYENAPCGYLSLQPDGHIVKANRTFSTWTGFAPEQLLGKRLRDLLGVAGSIFYETHFAPLLRMQGYFHEVALDLVTAKGAKLAVLVNATEKLGDNGELLFTRITLFQATQRRSYERGLVDARRAAAAAGAEIKSKLDLEQENAELREQFIAVLGHDLRNPLASMVAATRMLRREPQSVKAVRILDLMSGSVVRMSGLIDNVLDFAHGRLGSGIALNRNADQPLEPILLQVVDELRSSHPDRAIETNFTLADPVNCDQNRIGQLASNLLGNALTHGAADQLIRVRATTHNGTMELWVSNGGAAIPKETMARLFQPFFRGEASANLKGLGLGLYIASEVARAHGGQLSVSSTTEETRFTFVMPLI